MSDNLIINIISLVLLAFILMLMFCYSIYDMAENKENFNLGETVAFSVIITVPTIFMIVFMERINMFF